MKRILLTGMSATGKSTLINALAPLGYKAVDADCDAFSTWVTVNGDEGIAGSPVEPDRDWVWREDRIRVLDLIDSVEPLLRRVADHEINTDAHIDEVVATVLRLTEHKSERTNGNHDDNLSRREAGE